MKDLIFFFAGFFTGSLFVLYNQRQLTTKNAEVETFEKAQPRSKILKPFTASKKRKPVVNDDYKAWMIENENKTKGTQ